jgi:hypothetical protein
VLALLCLNLLLLLFKNLPYRPRQTGFVMVHVAMIWILVSAGITRYFGHEGVMPIREGSSTDFVWWRETHLQIVSGGGLPFPVQLYAWQAVHRALGQARRPEVPAVGAGYWPLLTHLPPADSGPAALR